MTDCVYVCEKTKWGGNSRVPMCVQYVCLWMRPTKEHKQACLVCVCTLQWLWWIRQHRLRDWGLGNAVAGGMGQTLMQTQWQRQSTVLLLCIRAVFWVEHNTPPSYLVYINIYKGKKIFISVIEWKCQKLCLCCSCHLRNPFRNKCMNQDKQYLNLHYLPINRILKLNTPNLVSVLTHI